MSSVDKSAPEGWELYIVSKEQEKNTNNEWKVGEQYYGCAAPGSLVSSQNYPSNFQQIQCQHDYIKSILSRQNVNDPRVLNTTNTTNTTNTSSNPTSNINNSTNNMDVCDDPLMNKSTDGLYVIPTLSILLISKRE